MHLELHKQRLGRRQGGRGFTLVEILIVVIILGILAAIVIPQFSSASQDSRISSLKSQLQTVRSAIQVYQMQHMDTLPDLSGTWTPLLTQTTPQGATSGGPLFGPYLPNAPVNALTGGTKYFRHRRAGSGLGMEPKHRQTDGAGFTGKHFQRGAMKLNRLHRDMGLRPMLVIPGTKHGPEAGVTLNHSARGFLLIEAMIATVILAVAAMGIVSLLLSAKEQQTALQENSTAVLVGKTTDGRDRRQTLRIGNAGSGAILDNHRQPIQRLSGQHDRDEQFERRDCDSRRWRGFLKNGDDHQRADANRICRAGE